MGAEEKDKYMKRAADIRCGNVEGARSKPQNSAAPHENAQGEATMEESPVAQGDATMEATMEESPVVKGEETMEELQKSQMKMCVSTENGGNGGGAASTMPPTDSDSDGDSESDAGQQEEDTSIDY